ncbi:DoxX family protein [Halpernia sp.]|uniref:DoxX family protein n=1 Tax=Halpernia sp. TaxID=2782209 RepID=UPI003A91466A
MKINSISYNKNAVGIILSLVRIFVGFAMLTHGYPKLQKLLSGEEIQFVSLFGFNEKFTLILAVLAEFVSSIFIILGLFTRSFCLPLILTMIIAGFVIHSPDVFADRELAFLYLAIYALIFVLGGGNLSIDALMSRRKDINY